MSARHLVFDNTSTNVITGLDLVGSHQVGCVVTDSLGNVGSLNPQNQVTIVATAQEDLHIQITWDAPATDVDLHVIREFPAGVYELDSDNDCYDANCREVPGNGTAGPLWDEDSPTRQGGNPSLDVDDVEGYGPENINIETPLPGNYKAQVHDFSDHGNGATVVNVRVYVHALLEAEYSRLLSDGERWDVGISQWPENGQASWQELNELVP